MAMRALRFAAAGALAAVGLASPASATQIYVSGMSLANGYEFATFQRNPNEPAGAWAGGTEYTGQQDLTADYGDTNHAPHFNVFAWCVDVFNDIYIGGDSIVYNLVPLAVTNASEIAKVAAWGDRQLASGPNALISAAVQAEIWDLEYNMEIVPGSDPTLEAEVASINSLLPSLPAASGSMLSGSFAGGGSIAQTLFTVPEPASLALLGSSVLATALIRRRRRSQPAG
jgi:PEP-CTERM motif